MIRSPLRYPGGKSRAVEKIVALVPALDEFREPFIGGGSVFISLKQKFPDKKFWINDKYVELATFWRILQSDSESLFEQIWNWKREFSDGKKASSPSGKFFRGHFSSESLRDLQKRRHRSFSWSYN